MVNTLSNNKFFKPTTLYKEHMILDIIEKDSNITQRVMVNTIGSSVSVINDYVFLYEKKRYLTKIKHSKKNVGYYV